MTLPARDAERRCLLSIDIYCPPGAQLQIRRMPLLLSLDGTDGRAPFHIRILFIYLFVSNENRKKVQNENRETKDV